MQCTGCLLCVRKCTARIRAAMIVGSGWSSGHLPGSGQFPRYLDAYTGVGTCQFKFSILHILLTNYLQLHAECKSEISFPRITQIYYSDQKAPVSIYRSLHIKTSSGEHTPDLPRCLRKHLGTLKAQLHGSNFGANFFDKC